VGYHRKPSSDAVLSGEGDAGSAKEPRLGGRSTFRERWSEGSAAKRARVGPLRWAMGDRTGVRRAGGQHCVAFRASPEARWKLRMVSDGGEHDSSIRFKIL
jgi:hypothetical protein